VLSIGRLGSGEAAADYYVNRQAGCELDYYAGRGEQRGYWVGRGAAALGLSGELDEAGERSLRGLLAGCGADGEQQVAPVLRSDPRGRLPARPLVQAIGQAAQARGVPVAVLLGSDTLADDYAVLERRVEVDRRRARLPRAEVAADRAGKLAAAAGLDAAETYRGADGADRYAAALEHVGERVDVRRAGLDLTLSAPKSASLLYGLGGPDVGQQVQQAHRAAVTDALEYLQGECSKAMRGHHGGGKTRYVDSDGLIAAAFEHRSSRAGDPQLHTHLVVPNVLRGADGRFTAIDTRSIYKHAMTAGYVYQAVLRAELTGRLGVDWTPVRRGMAEIEGIPREVLRGFSRRRSQIEAEMQRVGGTGRLAAQVATLATRPTKARADTHTLRGRWRARAAELGYRPGRLSAALGRIAGPAAEPDGLADRLLGAGGLTERSSHFDRRALLRAVCEYLPAGADVHLDQLRGLATRIVRDERVVALDPDAPAGRRRYSTRDMLATERAAVNGAVRRADVGAGLVASADVEQILAAAGLPTEQQQMVRALTSSGEGVQIVVGPAGAGETAALAAARAAWEDAGYQTQGAALAAIAARGLESGAGIPARSLFRLLQDTAQIDPATGAPAGLPHRSVLVVDEASMVGTRTLAHLLELAERAEAKLVLVGDPRQLPEIDAGGCFAALSEALPPVRLDGNVRQAARWERDALAELRSGEVTEALDAYLDHDRVRVADDASGLQQRIVEDYLAARASGTAEGTVILTARRSDASTLNRAVRSRLIDSGQLGRTEMTVSGQTTGFRAGDEAVVAVNDYRRGLLNGTRGTVLAVDRSGRRLSFATHDGRSFSLPAGWLAGGRLAHGYALTCHRAQGVTVDTALLYGTSALHREAGYVGMSRGRQANHLYATYDSLVAIDTETDRCAADPTPDSEQRTELTHAALVERLSASRAKRMASTLRTDAPYRPAFADEQAREPEGRSRAG
jgi:conjugative relaxase-like TrwC/TraI family protein